MSEVQEKFHVKCEKTPQKRDKYNLYFPYNKEMVDNIKLLPSKERSWNGYHKYWELSTRGLYQLIKFFKGSNKIHFDFGGADDKKVFIDKIKKIDIEDAEKRRTAEALEKNKALWVQLKKDYEENYKQYWDQVHKYLKPDIELYPHQVVAALFLNQTKSALLALEMGLGKSLSSIAYVEMNGMNKVFVITPNSLKFNFYNEIEKFTTSKAHIVKWKGNEHSIKDSKYIIMNYEFYNSSDRRKMDQKFKELGVKKIDAVICDEAHRLKNSKSNTYKNFKRLFKKEFFTTNLSKIFLSGTPAPNRAYELYNVLNQISPIDFATKKHFYEYYCGMTYDLYGFGWQTDITKQHLEDLFHKIAPYTYRKKKEEVLTDLPDKIYQKIILEMDEKEQKAYEEIEEGVANEIFDSENNPLTIMIRLRQYSSALKISRIKEVIDSILEEGEKIVVVDVFKPILYEINKHYPDISIVHTGDQSVEERADMVKQFQNPDSDVKIFLGSIQTCNYGLTLTAANKLLILTLPFSVGEYDQVSDRLHRIGQKDIVNIYPVIFRDTIDEAVFSTIESKRREINKVIDNEDYQSEVSESVLSDVLKMLKDKYKK